MRTSSEISNPLKLRRIVEHNAVEIPMTTANGSNFLKDRHRAIRPFLRRPLVVFHRRSHSATMTSMMRNRKGLSLSLSSSRLSSPTFAHPRKTRKCCRRDGNSRFVSHLDFRASETIPHPFTLFLSLFLCVSRPSAVPFAIFFPHSPFRRPASRPAVRSFCFLRADRATTAGIY